MIDARIGQTEPCPMCGSTEARWRGRRVYDFVFTCGRFMVERTLYAFGFGRLGPSTPGGHAEVVAGSFGAGPVPHIRTASTIDDVNRDIHHATLRDVYEIETGMAVAKRYWKCRSCKRRGQVFEDLDRMLAARGELARLEGNIEARNGAVSEPIDRDGM